SSLTTESTIQKNEIFTQVQDELNSVAQYLNNLEAQTINRFLGLRPNSTYVKYNQQSKSPFDVIIVDEASMLDMNIFIKLI
ncbi:exodeoxyribonuclease V subunit alpha, partial [Francisella tularensis subsp. holarctica]|uniref:AAA family ATPase n=1 Tax=Francisella tularensis TaxID=263 RepID=UPI0023AD2134|nr:exodeoxyribonuclease V subunit alpha [Francisella tularensis subsp. holarctica]